MEEQRLCSGCGEYRHIYKVEPRYIGWQGYVEIVTCHYCQEKTQRESELAVKKATREQKYCSVCARYIGCNEDYLREIRQVRDEGLVEFFTCTECLDGTQKESSAAVEGLKERVMGRVIEHDDKVLAGKLDATQRLLEEYASDPERLSLLYFASKIHRLYTGKESE